MDDMIASHIRRKHNMMVGEMTSERVKHTIGRAVAPQGDGMVMAVKGRDLVNGRPSEVSVSEAEVAEALAEPVGQIVGAVRAALERSEEHTSELQSLMRISYAVFCLKKKTYTTDKHAIRHTRR